MKKITLVLAAMFAICYTQAQTTLAAGDIAFLGSNTDAGSTTADNVSFVLLKDIDAATQIIFTDRGWNDTGSFSNFPGDGELTWTSGSARSAGDIIVLDLSFGALSNNGAYSNIGDQLFALQGSIAAPVFIAGLHFNVVTNATDDANWDGSATTNSTSALPNALTTGNTAVRFSDVGDIEQDNFQFSCTAAGGSPITGTAAGIRTILHDPSNWDSNFTLGYNPPVEAGCTVLLAAGADATPPVITCGPTPADLTAGIDGMAAVPDLVSGSSATDDVSIPANITITQSPPAGTMVGVGVNMVTVTAMDEAGNSANCMIDVTVLEPPGTSLTAGDIAFVGFNSDGTDEFAFILLTDIIAGTNIKFTDCGVDNPNTIDCGPSDGSNTWYSTAAQIAGTIITLPGSFFPSGGLASQGDQILAYQGTVASPTFLAGIHVNVESGTTNDADWDGGTDPTMSDESALPDQLTNGVNALRVHATDTEIDNWQLDCSSLPPGSLSGTKEQIAAVINDLQYWVSNDATEFSPAVNAACLFTVVTDTPPTLVSTSPLDDATEVALDVNLVLNFDEPVQAGTGGILIRDASSPDNSIGYPTAGPLVTISGSTVTLNPSGAFDLDPNLEYYILIDDMALQDLNGNNFEGISDTTIWNFMTITTADADKPMITSFNPEDNAVDVPVDANLIITFDEPIRLTGSNMVLRNVTSSTDLILLDGVHLSASGNQVIIDPQEDLEENTEYFVFSTPFAVEDLSGNNFSGISAFDWSFTTGALDTDPPMLGVTNPVDDAINVPLEPVLTAVFNEPIQWASGGTIIIQDITDNSVFGTLTEVSPAVSFSGNSMVIDPMPPFVAEHEYEIQVPATALEDTAGNPFAGIAPDGWTFTIMSVNTGSMANDITAFDIPGGSTSIDNTAKTVTVTVPFGTNVTALIPTISVSALASVNPISGAAQDFTTSVPYTVTAENTDQQVWTVSVLVAPDTPPMPVSFTRQNPSTNPTNADVLTFRATFDQDVFSVGLNDFEVTGTTGAITSGSVVNGRTFDLFVTGGDLANLNGTVGFNLAPDQIIINGNGTALPNGEPAIDETYTIDNTPPAITCPPDVVLSSGTPTDPGTTGTAVATDANGIDVVSFTDTVVDLVTTRTWSALDNAGNSSTCVQMITVESVPMISVLSFNLIDADNNVVIGPLMDGDEIDISTLPTMNLNIQAVATDNTESVELVLDGAQQNTATENFDPYALFADNGGTPVDYFGNVFIVGAYTLTATPYSDNVLGGMMGTALTIDFSFVESPVDNDGDGFFSDVDCDDTDPAINPDAEEVCDGIDNNCDGLIDAEDMSVTCDTSHEGFADLIDATYLMGASNPSPTGPILRVEEGNRETYLKFDLSGFVGPITNAELRMTVASDPGHGTLEVFLGSDSNWTETGLNGSNKPTAVGGPIGFISGTHSLGQTKVWDLDVSGLTGGAEITLIVKHSNGNDVAFASDETAQAPQLTITTGSSGPVDPIADAGEDQEVVLPTNTITLNGSGFDPDGGDIVSYQWFVVQGPNAPGGMNINTPNVTVSNMIEGTYIFRLEVTDDEGAIGSDLVTVTVVEEVVEPPMADLIDATYLQGASNPSPQGPILRAEEGNRVTYLKFDLSEFTGPITNAELQMTVASDPGNGTLEVFLGSDSNWTENDLNGSNKPSEVGGPIGSITGTHSLGQTKVWILNVEELTGSEITLIVKHSNGNDVAFASDETDQAPKLIITTDGPVPEMLNNLNLFPNPASEEVTIGFDSPTQVGAIFIYDVSGKLVQAVPPSEVRSVGDYQLNISGIPSGMYFVRTFDERGVPHQKPMVIKN